MRPARRVRRYYRVSTQQQGTSGLGLEAQRQAVERHIGAAGGVIVAEFQEIESGKKNDRPQIAAVYQPCQLDQLPAVGFNHKLRGGGL